MKKQVYNPYLPLHEYIPDGEPHVFGDRIYIFGSHDREGGDTFCELDYCVYSASVKDLTEWRKEGIIYSASQDPHSQEEIKGAGKRKYLYAPDVVQGNDGRFYLYYCLSAREGKGGFSGPVSVAVCDTPAGRYKYYGDVQYADGRPVKRFIPFDPAVINDKGRIYLYYGWSLPVPYTRSRFLQKIYRHLMKAMFFKSEQELMRDSWDLMGAKVIELQEDMLTVKEEPRDLIPGPFLAKGTTFEGHAFFEASSIRKVGDLYYFIYSTQVNHELAYAVSIYPDRDFTYGGVIVSNGDVGYEGRKGRDRLAATGNNHGSIEKVDGQWYVFYHRHTHLSSNSRQGMAEKIHIDEKGDISQVEMTSCGLNCGPLDGEGKYPAVIACNLTNGHMPHIGNANLNTKMPMISHQGTERFIDQIGNKTLIGYKYFSFSGRTKITLTVRGRAAGYFLISFDKDERYPLSKAEVRPWKNWTKIEAEADVEGDRPLYLIFKGRGKVQLKEIEFS